MSEDRIGEFEILVLAALLRLGKDAYGVSVRHEIEAQTGRSVTIGAVYTTLGRLSRKGMVTAHLGEATAQRGGRAKKYFHIEAAGKKALKAALTNIGRMTEGLSLSW